MADDIDVYEACSAIWRRRNVFFLLFIGSAIVGYTGSFLLDEKFESNIVLVPAEHTNASSMLSGLSGLASQFSGFIGAPALKDDTATNLAILNTRSLLIKFVDMYSVRQQLFPERWNSDELRWQAPPSIAGWVYRMKNVAPYDQPPTDEETLNVLRDNMVLSENKQNGVITISMFGTSRELPSIWLNDLVELLNSRIREDRIKSGQSNLEYLMRQVEMQEHVEIRQEIYALIGEEMKQMLVYQGVNNRAFKVIDQAVPPDEASSPRRAVIAIMLSLIVCLPYLLLLLLRQSPENISR